MAVTDPSHHEYARVDKMCNLCDYLNRLDVDDLANANPWSDEVKVSCSGTEPLEFPFAEAIVLSSIPKRTSSLRKPKTKRKERPMSEIRTLSRSPDDIAVFGPYELIGRKNPAPVFVTRTQSLRDGSLSKASSMQRSSTLSSQHSRSSSPLYPTFSDESSSGIRTPTSSTHTEDEDLRYIHPLLRPQTNSGTLSKSSSLRESLKRRVSLKLPSI